MTDLIALLVCTLPAWVVVAGVAIAGMAQERRAANLFGVAAFLGVLATLTPLATVVLLGMGTISGTLSRDAVSYGFYGAGGLLVLAAFVQVVAMSILVAAVHRIAGGAP